MRAAETGKHVICEKPCAVSAADLQEMISACKKNRVQFMDGVMFMHNARLPRVREVLDDGKSVGPLRRISSAFSFLGTGQFPDNNIRVDGRLEPAGCLGDLGWYCIRFTLWALNWQLPHTVVARSLAQSKPAGGRVSATTDFSAELFLTAGFRRGFTVPFSPPSSSGFSSAAGTVGCGFPISSIRLTAMNRPLKSIGRKSGFRWLPGVPATAPVSDPGELGHPTAQNTVMVRNFANQVFSGKLNDDWPMWALKTQQVMDACLESAQKAGKLVKLLSPSFSLLPENRQKLELQRQRSQES